MGVFAIVSGLNKMVAHYPTTRDPGKDNQIKQTLKIGVVRYRRCVTVDIGTEGLFLWVRPPLGRQAKLLIPWDEIQQVREGKLYGRQGVRLTIGDPKVAEITVYRDLFVKMKIHLSEGEL